MKDKLVIFSLFSFSFSKFLKIYLLINLVALADGVDLEMHRPLGKTKIIHHKLKCHPCDWSTKCEKFCGVWCMDLISVKEVLNVVDEFIKQK